MVLLIVLLILVYMLISLAIAAIKTLIAKKRGRGGHFWKNFWETLLDVVFDPISWF